ncbi:MAG: alpha/beta hydrolase, partial [Bacteroidia bacterium]
LFDNYIIVSPSLWWDNESLLKKANQLPDPHSKTSKKIYVSVGHEHRIMYRDAKALYKVLKKKLPQSQVNFDHLPKESHATILHRSVYNALEIFNPKK